MEELEEFLVNREEPWNKLQLVADTERNGKTLWNYKELTRRHLAVEEEAPIYALSLPNFTEK